MNTKKWMTVLAGLCAVVLWLSADTQAGVLNRLGANFIRFAGGETSTAALAPGIAIFARTVLVPPGAHTLYLTMGGATDQHGGARSFFTALVDGAFCRTSPLGSIDGAPANWITLLHIPAGTGATNCDNGAGGDGDCHDNATYYTWCCTITPSLLPTLHTATFRMASSISGQSVFIEKAHFFVDSTDGFGGQCGAFVPGLGLPR